VILAHTGSNGYWLAEIRIDARRDQVILIAMNAGPPAGQAAIEQLMKDIREALK